VDGYWTELHLMFCCFVCDFYPSYSTFVLSLGAFVILVVVVVALAAVVLTAAAAAVAVLVVVSSRCFASGS
jgi:hypothetical protein